jgi:type II secretory ATPase GspE/PulE/Tfp pilus assembly ATPase PilB-like protein
MTLTFDDDKSRLKINEIREQEEEGLLREMADNLGLSFTTILPNAIEMDALNFVKEEEAKKLLCMPFKIDGKTISIATRFPENEEFLKIVSRIKAMGYKVEISITSEKILESAFEAYKNLSLSVASKAGTVDITAEALDEFVTKVTSVADVKRLLTENFDSKVINTSRTLEIILAGAISTKASDIHLEAEEKDARLRYRLDGMLYDITTFDQKTFHSILSRIKLLSGLKLNVKSEAQDGRFAIAIGDGEIEIRTSIIPGGFGEASVLRILNPKSISVPLEDLGFNKKLLGIISELIARPQGMILTTGPTGSGKTTTLYAFLKKVYEPSLKILTIEDPIEYRLGGIVQTQVEEEKGYGFLSGLRSALRQDPDIIMVGEIRDEETARTAIDAALTGHLVFSTLHTNNAAGAFTRLIDLKANPKVITSAVSASLAQRLIRKLCPHCRKEVSIEAKDKEVIEKIVANMPYKDEITNTEKMWLPVGCEKCSGIGYKGRIGVYEAIISNSEIEKIVESNPSEREIQKIARGQGIYTMAEDGIVKVLQGITSLEELKRSVDIN